MLDILRINFSLNRTYARLPLSRAQIDLFKSEWREIFAKIDAAQDEEYHKNLIAKGLQAVFYQDYLVNVNKRQDLVIREGKRPTDPVGVILEFKKPDNRAEMISEAKPNAKALHELILYYLRETLDHNNHTIKHLVATNIWEWYIFDGVWFEKNIFRNAKLRKDYEAWKMSEHDTHYFYTQIAKPFLENLSESIPVTYFNLADYQAIIQNDDEVEDEKLLELYKVLSPEHLLKKPFANDSNTLNREFYEELLHIIGLTEVKEGGKKILVRLPENARNEGSMLENVISKLPGGKKLAVIPNLHEFGESLDNQLFSVALELCITWLNRILFLKLLEGQIVRYHRGSRDYAFLHLDKIRDFDELDELFFEVLAVKVGERSASVSEKYGKIPYLNSSLFEPTQLELQIFTIGCLKDRLSLPLFTHTVLKDAQGTRRSGARSTLQYLFEFLDAYDFGAEGNQKIQAQSKTIINAAVLGLIFEKLNGYQDGSFFTPGFITMYMCRQTIREAILAKFRTQPKYAEVTDFEALKEKIDPTDRAQRQAANQIINSLRVCDPAVGSGHFLVSALNELIASKSELGVLNLRDGSKMKYCQVFVENDELAIIEKESGEAMKYALRTETAKRVLPEIQEVQEAIFHEKQTLIENCLFGVDINPKSVLICRLRLWIELLKNAYYITPPPGDGGLQTLPNLDINIKSGNSLVSRFGINGNQNVLKSQRPALKSLIDRYKTQVLAYKLSRDSEEKDGIRKQIAQIKLEFERFTSSNDKDYQRLREKQGELGQMTMVFSAADNEKRDKLAQEVAELETKYKEKLTSLYRNAFEWRFEFPEVLNDEGDFVGFDVVVGNPPYISHDKITFRDFLKSQYKSFEAFADLYCYFFELAINILNKEGIFNLITSNSFLKADYGKSLRKLLVSNGEIKEVINLDDAQIFDNATVNTVILEYFKSIFNSKVLIVNKKYDLEEKFTTYIQQNYFWANQADFTENNWNLLKPELQAIAQKMDEVSSKIADLGIQINLGLATGSNEVFVIDEAKKNDLIMQDPKNEEIIKPILRGRDIKRYAYEFNQNYILLTRNEVDVQKDYPTIYQYLDSFGNDFKNRGAKGKHWTNLRACSFFDDFKKEKIIWIELSDENRFALCENEMYLLNSAYFLIPPSEIDIRFLLGLLNSKAIKFYFNLIANTSGMGTTRWINIYVKQFPIPQSSQNQAEIINLVNQILTLKRADPQANTQTLENQIDSLVYELYKLSAEEVEILTKF